MHEKILTKKVQIDDNTNNASISKPENDSSKKFVAVTVISTRLNPLSITLKNEKWLHKIFKKIV